MNARDRVLLLLQDTTYPLGGGPGVIINRGKLYELINDYERIWDEHRLMREALEEIGGDYVTAQMIARNALAKVSK